MESYYSPCLCNCSWDHNWYFWLPSFITCSIVPSPQPEPQLVGVFFTWFNDTNFHFQKGWILNSSGFFVFFFDCHSFPLTFSTRHGSTKTHPREFHGSRHGLPCLCCVKTTWLTSGYWDQSFQPVDYPQFLACWFSGIKEPRGPGGSPIFWFKWKHSTVGRSDPQTESALHGRGRN